MRLQPRLLAAGIAGVALGCRRPLPARPDQLAPGTFAATVRGRMGPPWHPVPFEDRVTGAACRVGTSVLLETRRRSHMFTVRLPAFPDTPARYPLRAPAPLRFRPDAAYAPDPPAPELPGEGPVAKGHLNYGASLRGKRPQHGSMLMVGGTVAVALLGSGDLRGTVRAQLREGLDGEGNSPPPATAELVGVFRVEARDVCHYARPARSGLTRF